MHTSMTWADTQVLASISLAIVPNGLPKADVAAIRKNIVERGDLYLGLAMKEGYRLPFSTPKTGLPVGLDVIRADQRPDDGRSPMTSPTSPST